MQMKHQIERNLTPARFVSVDNDNRETGATNLMNHHNLEHSYNKFTGKKMKDSLSSFLTNLPGVIDTPGSLDNR